MDAYLVLIVQRLGRAMSIADADYLSPNDLLLEIQANDKAEDEFLLLSNFINSSQVVESFMNGTDAPDKYEAVKKAHKKNLAALKAKIDALEAGKSK